MAEDRPLSEDAAEKATDLEMRAVRYVVSWIVSGGKTPGIPEPWLAKAFDPLRIQRFGIVCPLVEPGAEVSADPRVEVMSLAAARDVHRSLGSGLATCWSLRRESATKDCVVLRARSLFDPPRNGSYEFRFRPAENGLRIGLRYVWDR